MNDLDAPESFVPTTRPNPTFPTSSTNHPSNVCRGGAAAPENPKLPLTLVEAQSETATDTESDGVATSPSSRTGTLARVDVLDDDNSDVSATNIEEHGAKSKRQHQLDVDHVGLLKTDTAMQNRIKDKMARRARTLAVHANAVARSGRVSAPPRVCCRLPTDADAANLLSWGCGSAEEALDRSSTLNENRLHFLVAGF